MIYLYLAYAIIFSAIIIYQIYLSIRFHSLRIFFDKKSGNGNS